MAAKAKPESHPWKISGPFAHENLSVFLLHGEDRLKGRDLLTLEEAVSQKKVTVHETGNVQELAVENPSEAEIFIQAGDIVKGGKQDRVLSVDLVLYPKSGRIPITSFCVEQGRWTRRGAERAGDFHTSSSKLSSRASKLAVRHSQSQGAVWKEVEELQTKLTTSLGGPVSDMTSITSLPLTLETKVVTEAAGVFTQALKGVPEGHPDAVGFAFAVNGELNSAEAYASPSLFRKMWPQLLQAAVIEALGERKPGKGAAALTAEAVKAFLEAAERGPAKEHGVSERIRRVSRETKTEVMFETAELPDPGAWLHRSYIRK
jgi:hypothetical protein